MGRFDEQLVAKTAEALHGIQKVVLIPHIHPDGDAMGSSLGLTQVMRGIGFDVEVVAPSGFPDFLRWLEGSEDVTVYEENAEVGAMKLAQAEIIIFLDFNDIKRSGEMAAQLEALSIPKVMIDHHPNPNTFADYIFSDPSASSTAELVFHFIEAMAWEPAVNRAAANALLAGIITDTGSFSYNASAPSMYEVVGKLMAFGADKDKIHASIYYSHSADRMKLLGYCLNEKMVVLPEYHTAFISLTQDEMERYHFKAGDNEGFVNYPLGIKGIIFTAFFTEKEDRIKISFRSRGGFPANEFSGAHFGGGGHKNAAGGVSFLPMEETLARFNALVPDYADRLKEETERLG